MSSYKHCKVLGGIAACAMAIALAGCASSTTAPSAKPAPAPKPAPAAKAAPAAPAAIAIPKASGDQGTVVFFRESKFVGGAVSFKVREGETELGKLSSGSYFIVQVPTGAHQYTVHSEAKDILNLEIEKGETYYVQGSVSMGALVGHPNLAPSSAAAFDAVKAKLKNTGAPK